MIHRRRFLAGTAGLLLPLIAVRAGFAATLSKDLAPGEFIWEPELSPDGPVVIIVSLPDQLVHVYRNGVEIGISTCSSGKPGHRTPTGVFVILQKDKNHHSSTYNNAPMPNMERLTWSGIALHAGDLPGYPASHGCVRLPMKFSELLYGITHLGMAVIIADEQSQPNEVVYSGLILPEPALTAAADAVDAAGKAEAPTNVASGIVSAADKKVYLLLDGEIAWESPIEITDPSQPLGDHSFTLLGLTPDGKSYRWMSHDLSGDTEVLTRQDVVLSRIKVQQQSDADAILAKTASGSTLVVTDLAAEEGLRTQPGFVVIDAEAEQV